MGLITPGVLQAATTVVKTAETDMGEEVSCGHYDTITIFLDYVKGDETGVYVIPYALLETGGDEYQWQTWSATAGDKTSTSSRALMTATGKYYITFDVRGIRFIKFKHQASGGTPTGTLAANYTLTAI